MISPDMDDAWRELLYGSYGNGIVSANGDIVETAISQLGNIGGQPFWSWYGFSSRVEWCACFVSWCADQNGFITAGVIPKFSYCDSGIAWFKEKRTCGRMAGMSLSPATLFSLTGTETVYPTM